MLLMAFYFIILKRMIIVSVFIFTLETPYSGLETTTCVRNSVCRRWLLNCTAFNRPRMEVTSSPLPQYATSGTLSEIIMKRANTQLMKRCFS